MSTDETIVRLSLENFDGEFYEPETLEHIDNSLNDCDQEQDVSIEQCSNQNNQILLEQTIMQPHFLRIIFGFLKLADLRTTAQFVFSASLQNCFQSSLQSHIATAVLLEVPLILLF